MTRFTVLVSALSMSFALASPALAQSAASPSLTANIDGVRSDEMTSDALQIASMDVQITVRGSIAETEMTIAFANPSQNTLEGTFAFDMPRGSVVTGYALDVGGNMIDGVLETRYKAQEAFQRRVTQRIDPGLAEVDYSDRFETRVFPIFPNAGRTIRLRIVSPMDADNGYLLPLSPGGKISKLTVSIKTEDGEKPRKLLLADGLQGDWGEGGYSFTGENVALDGEISFAAELGDGAITVSEHPGEGRFFEISDSFKPAAMNRKNKDAGIRILWDTSVSRSDDDLEKEYDLLRQYLRANISEDVAIIFFGSGDIRTVKAQRGESPDDLVHRIKNVRFRGGTSFEETLADAALAEGIGACLIFTDGRVTMGSRSDFAMPCKSYFISSSPEQDRPWLTQQALKTGGAYIDLTSTDIDFALNSMSDDKASVTAVRDSGGRAVDYVVLPTGDNTLRIVGRLPSDNFVRVDYAGTPGGGAIREYRASGFAAPNFTGPGALWAAQQIGAVASDMTPDQVLDFSRRYSVASPFASFIVLETPNDYAISNIVPPDSYPKPMRAEFDQIRASLNQQEAAQREGQLARVIGIFNVRREWWQTKFDPNAKKAKNNNESSNDAVVVTGSRVSSDENAVPPPPPPPPPPQPVTSAPQQQFGFFEESAEAESGDIIRERENEMPKKARDVEVVEWSADRPYITAFEKAGDDYENAIDEQAEKHGSIPLYWFDVAEWHFSKGRTEEAALAAEAALELPVRDNQTLAIAAAKLLRFGKYDRAIWLLERLAERETDRPQPKRSLALAFIARGEAADSEILRMADYNRALALLNEVLMTPSDGAYNGIEDVTLMDANALIARGADSAILDERIIGRLDTDIRIVAEWNTPRTDLDLWIEEPNGEKVGYSNKLSARGGRMTDDMTNGYGPEEYALRVAAPGEYIIRANTFAAARTNPNGPSTVTLRIYRNFGRVNQSVEVIDVEMKPDGGDMRLMGRIVIE